MMVCRQCRAPGDIPTSSSESRRSAVSSQVTGIAPEGESSGEFGANEWLVDEMYERWLVDKNTVDESRWPVLEHYKPGDKAQSSPEPTTAPAEPEASTPPPTDPTPTSAIPTVPDSARAQTAPLPADASESAKDQAAGGQAQIPDEV